MMWYPTMWHYWHADCDLKMKPTQKPFLLSTILSLTSGCLLQYWIQLSELCQTIMSALLSTCCCRAQNVVNSVKQTLDLKPLQIEIQWVIFFLFEKTAEGPAAQVLQTEIFLDRRSDVTSLVWFLFTEIRVKWVNSRSTENNFKLRKLNTQQPATYFLITDQYIFMFLLAGLHFL